jgi:hypothetical protein
MCKNFEKVKNFLLELEYSIVKEDEENKFFLIEKEEAFIKNMVIDIDEPILLMEQILFKVKGDNPDVFKKLLQKNRDIIHGAFILDDAGEMVSFRDTLEVENLDKNELEGSLNSLSLLLNEFGSEIITFAK